MNDYINSLHPSVRKKLEPYLDTYAEAERRHGLPPGALVKFPVMESGGDVNAVGDIRNKDGSMRRPEERALGARQVLQKNEPYWYGGPKPADEHEAIKKWSERMGKLYTECGGDQSCLHFKYMAGPGQAYTPENVARVVKNHPHVAARMNAVVPGSAGALAPAPVRTTAPNSFPRGGTTTAPAPLPPPAPAEALLGYDWAGVSPQGKPPPEPQFLPVAADDALGVAGADPFWGGADPFGLSLKRTGAPSARRVKSAAPSSSLFGL